jgi:predicted porin
MNKKLITLAVAAAMAAPAAAMAEATLYGKLHVHLDYAEVKNAVGFSTNRDGDFFSSNDGPFYIGPDGNPTGTTVVTPDGDVISANDVIFVDENGRVLQSGNKKFSGWGVDSESWGKYTGNNPLLPRVQGPANRLGVKGSEDLGNGLKAIYQVELGVNFASVDDNIPSGRNGGISVRNSFVGLAGDWGTFFIGRHDTPLKISTGKLDLFVDTVADYNGTVGFDDLRTDNTVAYISPSFSGFSLAAAMIAGGSATAIGEQNVNEDSIAGAYSLAGIFNNGPFYVSAAYESLDKDMFMDTNSSLAGKQACFDSDGDFITFPSCSYIDSSYNKWRIGLGLLDWNGFTLTGIYEQQENRPSGQYPRSIAFVNADTGEVATGFGQTVEKQQLWQVQAAYAFGNNQIKAMYGSVDRSNTRLFGSARDTTVALDNLRELGRAVRDDLEGDRYTWAVGFDHNFSKRTKAYAVYTAVDDDLNGTPGNGGAEWNSFSLGMVHAF